MLARYSVLILATILCAYFPPLMAQNAPQNLGNAQASVDTSKQLTSPTVSSSDLQLGLLAYYPFNDTVNEIGISSYHGNASGNPAFAAGVSGRAISLDGIDDAVTFASLPGSAFAGDFSLSWFMQMPNAGKYSLIGKRAACSVSSHFDIRTYPSPSNEIAFELSRVGQYSVARNAISPRAWMHIAAVREGGVARVYVNGVAGADVQLPSGINFSTLTTPLGIGTSPCIAFGDGTLRPRMRMDELRIYNRALPADQVAALARMPQMNVLPSAASAGATVEIHASNLVQGRGYQIVLVSPTNSTVLLNPTALNESVIWPLTIPAQAPGQYSIELRAMVPTPLLEVSPTPVLERAVPFTINSNLQINVISANPQAGKSVQLQVSGLSDGNLRLRYGEQIVYGPAPTTANSQSLKFVAPSNYPSNLPAQVTLYAELFDGQNMIKSGTQIIQVAAPFVGPFIEVQNLVVDKSNPKPGENIKIDARLIFKDGASSANTKISAFWVAQSGRITALSSKGLAVHPDGSFRLDTFPPSLGAMSAFTPTGPGHIRLVAERKNTFGKLEHHIVDGPLLATQFDNDADTDITIKVRKNIGGGQWENLENAFVVVDGTAPIIAAYLPPETGGGTSNGTGYATGGASYIGNTKPSWRRELGGLDALNQISEASTQFAFPQLMCGTSLFRRYTNVRGEVEFQIKGGLQEQAQTFQKFGMQQFEAQDCTAGCLLARAVPYKFYVTVYTLHRGAGYIGGSGVQNIEIPSRFEITYARDTQIFTIRNLRTNALSIQNTSAQINVDVPAVTGVSNFLTINDPLVLQEVGTKISLVQRQGGNGYGRWIEFSNNVSEYVNAAPVKIVRFGHKPSVNGSITSAKLYLPHVLTGQPSLIGDFNQTSFVETCNIQDDPSMGNTEHWELRIQGTLANSWRRPRGVFYANDAVQRKSCGYIEVLGVNGAKGRRNICFEWQEAPTYFQESAGNLRVDDSDMSRVLVELEGVSHGDSSNQTPQPGPVLGRPVEKPTATQSRSMSTSGLFDTITANGSGSSIRRFSGDNPKQFNEGASGAEQIGDFANGSNIFEIGQDEFKTILDQTIPLFKWYWGVPEILSAEIFADLRLFASYYYYGTVRRENNSERLDLLADALVGAMISVGVDIDVLFGFIVDAGAAITGSISGEIPIKVVNNQPQPVEPCIKFKMDFLGYVDPCPLCPTPVYEFDENIIDAQDPPNCSFYENRPAGSDLDLFSNSKQSSNSTSSHFGSGDARALRRHPSIGFDQTGNGHALMLANNGSLSATGISGQLLGVQSTLSAAPGVRQPKIAYYAPGLAMAVWLENSLSNAQFIVSNYYTIARSQRIAWATFDGEQWSQAQYLTAPGFGEAHPSLVACPANQIGCPAGGEVFLSWQRNESGDHLLPQHRIKFASWRPASAWSVVSNMDGAASNVQDITPSATYIAGKPFTVWVRQLGIDLNNFAQRRIAYRHIGVGSTAVAQDLGSSPISPSIVAGPGGANPEALIAFLKPEVGSGPIGTSLALHIGAAQCASGVCSWAWHRARDTKGRRIFGERPQLITTTGFDSQIILRGFRFEGKQGEPVYAGDAIGTVLSSGDLLSLQPNYANGVVRVLPISADGAMHFGHAAAFNPARNTVFTMASTMVPAGIAPLRSALKATGIQGQVAHGKILNTVGLVEIRGLPALPDFVIENVETDVTQITPNLAVATLVKLGNRGNSYIASRDGIARLVFRWNSLAAAPIASVNLEDIAGGGEREYTLQLLAPADAYADQAHQLYAQIEVSAEMHELSSDGNQFSVNFAGMPVPQEFASSTRPGAAVVQLGWNETNDTRVAGFRVYRLSEDQQWMPLGATPNNGFLDISAQFLVPRTYSVSSYSARGIESERSASITVMPVEPERTELELFGDGFELIK